MLVNEVYHPSFDTPAIKDMIANQDYMDLNTFIAPIICVGVSKLKEENGPIPNDMFKEEWLDVLQKIQDAFEILSFEDSEVELYVKKTEKSYDDIVAEGLMLFAIHYRNLWN